MEVDLKRREELQRTVDKNERMDKDLGVGFKEETRVGEEGKEPSPDHFEPVRTKRNHTAGCTACTVTSASVKSRRFFGLGWRGSDEIKDSIL